MERHSLATPGQVQVQTPGSPGSMSHQQAVLEIARSLIVESDLERLLGQIVAKAVDLLEAERCTLYLLDRARGELRSTRTSELEVSEIRLRLEGPGLAAYVARTGQSVNLEDAYADSRFNRSVDLATGWRTRSMLVVPLWGQEREVVGVLQVLNRRLGTFGLEDERLAEALAACAGTAIEAARLRGEERAYRDSLVELIAASADAGSPEDEGRSARVASYAVLLARALKMAPEQVEVVRGAALLREAGKLAAGEAPAAGPSGLGRLVEEERRRRERHHQTQEALARLKLPRALESLREIVGQQHERFDGRGWPEGRRGGEIALGARVLAAAELFDRVSSRRTRWDGDALYPGSARSQARESVSLRQAIELVRGERGGALDPRVVDAFERALPELTAEWERSRRHG